MFFFSIEFGIVFFVFFVLYWLLRTHLTIQNLLLLVFNYAILCYFGSFYFALVLAFYTLFIFAASYAIASSESKAVFLASVAFVVCNLSFFKYYSSFKDGFENLLRFFGLDFADIDVLLPLGLSFYSFASITYLRAVYEAKHTPSDYVLLANPKLESLPNLAAYLSFFPTIIAGPIMRSDFFFEQFKSLIYGYNNGRLAEGQREELYNQPKLLGFNGPMFNGYETLKSTGEKIAVIRYEKPTDF